MAFQRLKLWRETKQGCPTWTMDVHSLHMCGGATMHDGTQRSLVSAAQTRRLPDTQTEGRGEACRLAAGIWRAGASADVDRHLFQGDGRRAVWTIEH